MTESDLRNWVRSFVWTGEWDADEVPLLIEDLLCDGDEVDEGWLRDVIAEEFAAKQAEELTWPVVTDYDRLDRAFESLKHQGVIAIHMAGFTQSDGLEEVQDDYQDSGGKESNYAGHCFYTEQDQESAIDGHGLFMGYGHLSGDNAKGIAVGHLLQAALEAEGLNVEWDGTILTRLFIKDFRWQRRGPV